MRIHVASEIISSQMMKKKKKKLVRKMPLPVSARTLPVKWTLSKKIEAVIRPGAVLCIHLEKAGALPEAAAL